MSSLPDRAVALLVRGYFTKSNLLVHALVYPVLMGSEGGDFHLFLDGISIEAVFVGLLVGISTKQILDRHHGLRQLIADLHQRLRHDSPHGFEPSNPRSDS